jgi:hypothetical protein
VVCAGRNFACFGLYLEALDARSEAPGKAIFRVLANGPWHTRAASRAARAARAA